MIELDLTKDPIIVLLFKNIIRAASRISVHDQKLGESIAKLTELSSHLESVDYVALNQEIKKLAELVRGYETSHNSAGSPESTEEPSGLPSTIFNFMSKVEELKIKTDLQHKYFSVAELEVNIDQYIKLANRK